MQLQKPKSKIALIALILITVITLGVSAFLLKDQVKTFIQPKTTEATQSQLLAISQAEAGESTVSTNQEGKAEVFTQEAEANISSLAQAKKASEPKPVATQPTSNTSTNTTNTGQCAWPTAYLTPKSGNDLSVVVNKQYCLPSSYAPGDLVDVAVTGVRKTRSNIYIRQTLVTPMTQMISAAKADGIDLAVISCYRSYSTQKYVYNNWVAELGQTEAEKVSARPGHSEHQLGTTCDFTTNEISDGLGTHFANTKAGKWLVANAGSYGFSMSYPYGQEATTGYTWEPWHWRYQ